MSAFVRIGRSPGYLFGVSVDFIYNLFGNAGICIVVWQSGSLRIFHGLSFFGGIPSGKRSALIVRMI